MEIPRSKQASSSLSSLLIWVLVSGLLFQNLVLTVMSSSFEDQKCPTCSPDPGSGSHGGGHHHGAPPSHGGGGSYGGAPPSHGGRGGSHGGAPPSHGGGGGSYGGAPPSHGGENCGNPPSHGSDPGSPSTPSHNPTPSTPSHNNPTPSHPSSPSGGGSPPTPIIVGPPSTPTTPGFIPTPPFLPNNPFTGTCNYWLTHPNLIWGLLGWWGTIGSLFGLHSIPGFNPSLSLPQALSNTRTDGLGSLFREGTASILNSMVNNRFPYTTQQVRNSFVAALSSDKAASAQASLFKLANEGRLKPRA